MRLHIIVCLLLLPLTLLADLTPSAAVSRKYRDVQKARVDDSYALIIKSDGKKSLIPVDSLSAANLDWLIQVSEAHPINRGKSSVKIVSTESIQAPRAAKNTIVTANKIGDLETVQLVSPRVSRDQIGGTCMLYARAHWLDIAGYYVGNATIYKSINGTPPDSPWNSPNYVRGLETIITDHEPQPVLHLAPPFENNLAWARQQLRLGRPILAAFPEEIWQALPSGYLANRQWNGGTIGHQIVVNGFTYNQKKNTGTFHIVNTWSELQEFDLKLSDAQRGLLVFEQSLSPFGAEETYGAEKTYGADAIDQNEDTVLSVTVLKTVGNSKLYKVTTTRGVQRIIATNESAARRIAEESFAP